MEPDYAADVDAPGLLLPGVGRALFQLCAVHGATDAQVYLDSIFWNPLAVAPSGDIDGNGQFTCNDINQLTAAIASGIYDSRFDLNLDGILNTVDVDVWLTAAGAQHLPSGNPYQRSDANLDGTVDGQDFVTWNAHKFSPNSAFCAGDFNADGSVDGADFILWNTDKFTSADTSGVPEPTAKTLLVILLALIRRRSDPVCPGQ